MGDWVISAHHHEYEMTKLDIDIGLWVTQLNLLEFFLLRSSVKYKALQGKITNQEIKKSKSHRWNYVIVFCLNENGPECVKNISFIYRGSKVRKQVLPTLHSLCVTQLSKTDWLNLEREVLASVLFRWSKVVRTTKLMDLIWSTHSPFNLLYDSDVHE